MEPTDAVRVIAFGFTSGIEGASCDHDGNVYAVDYQRDGTIGRIRPDGSVEVWAELPPGSHGCGTLWRADGTLLVADYTGHRVLAIDGRDRAVRTMVHQPAMYQPNDLAATGPGIIFATDPDWEGGRGQLWRIDQHVAHLVETDMGTTNGIEVSPGDRRLYVNETRQRRIWVYDLSAAGQVSHKRLLIEFPDFGLDGMRCDSAGFLYVTRHGKGTIAVVSPDGAVVEEIVLPGRQCTNLAFGGADGCSVFVTLADDGTVVSFRAPRPGRGWEPA